MSGNQTSGKEGGVQCVMTVVCMYVCLISYMSDFKETQACRLVAGQVPVYPSSYDTNVITFCLVFQCFP